MSASAEVPQPGDTILTEVGKDIFTKSVETSAALCKDMLATSTATLAIYYGVITFLLPEDYRPTGDFDLPWTHRTIPTEYIALVPVVALLAAAFCFAKGYMPPKRDMNPYLLQALADGQGEIPNDVSVLGVRRAFVEHRRRWSSWGMALFIGGIALIAGVTIALVNNQEDEGGDKEQFAIVVDANQQAVCGTVLTNDQTGEITLQLVGASTPTTIDQIAELHLVDACPGLP
jgi:hypothetical protein